MTEFLEGFLGVTKRKQEKIEKEALQGIKKNDTLHRNVSVGPEHEDVKAVVADVSNEEFLRLTKEKDTKELLCHSWANFDDGISYEYYLKLGDKIFARSGTFVPDFSNGHTFADDIREEGFKFSKEGGKKDWLTGIWRKLESSSLENMTVTPNKS